jgi:cytochrome b6-f complex iron-sulfur subunit
VAGFGAGRHGLPLWPNLTEGFGTKIRPATRPRSTHDIKANDGYAYIPDGRFYLVPTTGRTTPGLYAGVAGGGTWPCTSAVSTWAAEVPWCATAQWWECPCHGSKYNQAGEYKEGPAPRGLDRFAIQASGSQIVVDTSKIITGPPRGTNTTGQELDGPHCVGGGKA